MVNLIIGLIAIIGTIASYMLARALYARQRILLFLPFYVALTMIIVVLVIGQIPYDTYMIGGQWIDALLGPAVVALAYPLYEHRELLRRLAFPILLGSLVGALVALFSGLLLSKLVNLVDKLLYTLLPTSVTPPVAMDITESFGGIALLAAILVIVAGLTGVLLRPLMFRIFNLRT